MTPLASSVPSTPATPTTAPITTQAAVFTAFAGDFVSRNHPTSGTAIVVGNGTGQRFLWFESFETDNGPALNVYLVNSSAGGVADFVDLET